MKKNNKKKGFTIVELVIVIAVIAILAGVLIPTFSNVIDKANDSAALQEARNIHTKFVADWDYSKGSPAQDAIIEVSSTEFVVVDDNQLKDEIYTTKELALEALEATNDTDKEATLGTAVGKVTPVTYVSGS